ncbi:STAR protein, partial [Polyodon spathula]|nr:STAR protein [Polyodon spathula]
ENGDVILSKIFLGIGKLFKLEAVLDATPKELHNELFAKVEEINKWNPNIKQIKVHQVDKDTTVNHEVTAETAGNLIGQRDFLSIRHCWKQKALFYLAGAAIQLESLPPQKGFARLASNILYVRDRNIRQTISRRLDYMTCHIADQLMEKLHNSEAFALQVDESTDVANDAQLLAFVRVLIYLNLLFHSEVRRLSRGAVLNRNFELCAGVYEFLPFPEKRSSGSSLTEKEEDQLTELFSDSVYKNQYITSECLARFWIGTGIELPEFAAKALKVVLPFAITFLCETGFSSLTALKTKYRSRLQPEHDFP